MGFEYDESRWPILVCAAISESSDDDMHDYFQLLERKLLRRERHVVIVDASRGKAMKGTHRKMAAAWNKKHADDLREYRAGLVVVAPNAALRGILTAVYWLFKPPFPYHTVDSLERARQWAEKQLDQANPDDARFLA